MKDVYNFTQFAVGIDSTVYPNRYIIFADVKNCDDDLRAIAEAIAEHTDSEVVQVIGRKIVLYRQARKPENRKIILK